jgi:hypothetical protein
LGVNPEQVTPQASFIEDLGADSLDIVELVMAFEEEFSVEVPDETPRNCRPSATSSNTSRNGRSRRNRRPGEATSKSPAKKHADLGGSVAGASGRHVFGCARN